MSKSTFNIKCTGKSKGAHSISEHTGREKDLEYTTVLQ